MFSTTMVNFTHQYENSEFDTDKKVLIIAEIGNNHEEISI